MPTALGKYDLVKRLAVGGMAEVFLAQTLGPMGFSKTLVVKRILPNLSENEDFVTMFLNEARLAALLNHANVVQIFDLGSEEGNYFLAMELVDGPNLRDLNKGAKAQGQLLRTDVVLKIISLACEGLAYAHEFVGGNGMPLRLVHRDISPHNILLNRSGNVKVADFGIAKAASIPSLTKTGKIKGKLKYMSPEQLHDQPLDLRSDVWAMGVTLYESLTGARPFDAVNDAGVIVQILNSPPPPLAKYEVEAAVLLQPIIDRALAKDREERYPDARALQTDLERVLIRRGAVVRGLEIGQAVARYCPVNAAPAGPSLPPIPAPPRVPLAGSAPPIPIESTGLSGSTPPDLDRQEPQEARGATAVTPYPRREPVLEPKVESTRVSAFPAPPAERELSTHEARPFVESEHEWPTSEAPPELPAAPEEPLARDQITNVAPIPKRDDPNAVDEEGASPAQRRAATRQLEGSSPPVPFLGDEDRTAKNALPPRAAPSRPIPVSEPPPVSAMWSSFQQHPVLIGFLAGLAVVAALLAVLVIRFAALQQK